MRGSSPTNKPFSLPNAQHIPQVQPLPSFTTPSAFQQQSSPGPPSRILSPPYLPQNFAYPSHLGHSADPYPIPGVAPSSITHPHTYRSTPSTIERAIESVQASLAAVHERLESLEHLNSTPPSTTLSRVNQTGSHAHSPPHQQHRHLPGQPSYTEWSASHMGAWSLIIRPLKLVIYHLSTLSAFFFVPPPANRSPLLILIRRLALDASFLCFVLFWLRRAWLNTGIRQQEVYRALTGLWYALRGQRERVMVSRGV